MKMATAIVVGVLIIIGYLSLRSGVKHFKGEGGCCGGGGDSVPKQKKKKVEALYTKIITIEGMHCDNCKNSVERNINEIEGASARVHLKKKQAVVEMDREIPDEALIEAVENAGFEVLKIER